MSNTITGVKPLGLRVYNEATEGEIVAIVVETDQGLVRQTTKDKVGGSGGGGGSITSIVRREIKIANQSTNGWVTLGMPIPAAKESFGVDVNGNDRNTQGVAEVDVPGQRIRLDDTDPFVPILQVVYFYEAITS